MTYQNKTPRDIDANEAQGYRLLYRPEASGYEEAGGRRFLLLEEVNIAVGVQSNLIRNPIYAMSKDSSMAVLMYDDSSIIAINVLDCSFQEFSMFWLECITGQSSAILYGYDEYLSLFRSGYRNWYSTSNESIINITVDGDIYAADIGAEAVTLSESLLALSPYEWSK